MKKNFTTFMALMASLLISAHCFAQDSLVPFDAHSSIWGGMFAPQSPEATAITRDCQGNPLSSTETVTVAPTDNNPTVKNTSYGYDGRGRLVYEDVYMNGSAVTSVSTGYDELGRRASVSGNGLTQTESYDFHGWLSETQASAGGTSIFKETLRYAEALHATPLHSGSITEVVWKHGNNTPCTYAYSYDGAGRLLGADRYAGNTLDNAWTERGITYDAGGNITSIVRYGSSGSIPVDDLTMSYSGNTLASVNNSSYSYDSAGNLTYDPLRGLTISYNLLGQPYAISTSSDEADYTYLADGTKVKVAGEANEDGYAYLGSMVFALSEGDWLFDSTPFNGGQIRKNGSSFVADRFATDHLGSVRALVRNGQVIEQNDFYPYGMRHANAALISASNRWRFSAKEIQTTAGVGLIDFGARLYDDRTCRWTSQDPLATKYPGISPYSYCAGDPVNLVDTDGNGPVAALGGTVIGGIAGGIIGVCEGKEGEELLGSIFGGAITGGLAGATDGLSFIPRAGLFAGAMNSAISGALSSFAGSAFEQWYVSGTIDAEQTVKDTAAGAAAGAVTKVVGSLFSTINNTIQTNVFNRIEQRYESPAAQEALQNEVKQELRNTGHQLGKSTKAEVKRTVSERTNTRINVDKAIVNGVSKSADMTQSQVIGWGVEKLTECFNGKKQ